MIRRRRILQEFGTHDENMLAADLFYFSDSVLRIWDAKKEAGDKGETYIGL